MDGGRWDQRKEVRGRMRTSRRKGVEMVKCVSSDGRENRLLMQGGHTPPLCRIRERERESFFKPT